MNHYIRIAGLVVLLSVGLVSTATAQSATNSDTNPNIVLVLMDNFGYGEIGVYGGGVMRGAATPNIDGIAAEGFQLTNFNVEAECTPSRSALMTGRYGIRTRQRPDGPTRGVWYGITKWEIRCRLTMCSIGVVSLPSRCELSPGERNVFKRRGKTLRKAALHLQ